jgi:sterol desaturase/sphingolipid hydroxylase (fatty acid hydroxylase superfamily)
MGNTMAAFFVRLTLSFVVLLPVFALLERAVPGVPGQRRIRRGFWTDVAYWFVSVPLSRAVAIAAATVAILVVAVPLGAHVGHGGLSQWLNRDTAIGRQPTWAQIVGALVVGDFVGYWMHRLFHRNGQLWRFHAVHHSSTDLDWLSSVRVHPVNDAVTTFAQVLPLLALGFRVGTLGPVAGILVFYAILIHANVRWSFGPLRYVVATPLFHRWHHTSQEEGLNKNFAGLLPLWDLLFGTFYLPDGIQPTRFGIDGDGPPEGLARQLLYPFRDPAARPTKELGPAAPRETVDAAGTPSP